MACGCGKKGNLPKRNVNAIKPAIQQSIVRSMGVNPPEQQKQQLEQALQVLSQPQQTAQTAPVDAAATTPVDTQAAQTTPAAARPTQR